MTAATATWVWVVVGVLAFPLVGILVMLALGAFGAPSDTLRRLWQTITFRRPVRRGVPLPDEVPERADDRERRER